MYKISIICCNKNNSTKNFLEKMLSYCPITSNFPLRIGNFVELTVKFS